MRERHVVTLVVSVLITVWVTLYVCEKSNNKSTSAFTYEGEIFNRDSNVLPCRVSHRLPYVFSRLYHIHTRMISWGHKTITPSFQMTYMKCK